MYKMHWMNVFFWLCSMHHKFRPDGNTVQYTQSAVSCPSHSLMLFQVYLADYLSHLIYFKISLNPTYPQNLKIYHTV
jgi:hypothetical protein